MVIEREQNMVNCINTEVRVSFYHFGDLHWKPSSSSNSSNENQQQISQRWHHDPKSKVLMEVEDETLSRGLDLLRTLESRHRSHQLCLVVGFSPTHLKEYEI